MTSPLTFEGSMDLGNAIVRTQKAQSALDQKMDVLMAKFGLQDGELPEGVLPLPSFADRMTEMEAKLDLILESIAALQPVSKKKSSADGGQ